MNLIICEYLWRAVQLVGEMKTLINICFSSLGHFQKNMILQLLDHQISVCFPKWRDLQLVHMNWEVL